MKIEGDYHCDICGESFETNVGIASRITGHKQSISSDHIIEELGRVAEQKGRTPMQPEVEEEAEFTAGAVQSTFESFSHARAETADEWLTSFAFAWNQLI